MIFVNIWNNVDGKLKIAGNKSMSENVMKKKNDFSTLVETPYSDIPHNPSNLYNTLSRSVGPVGYPVISVRN